MNANSILTLCALAVSLLLTGCSTPAPVRDLASRSAATVGLAEASLRNYVAATNAQLDARMQLLRSDAQTIQKERLRRELERFYDQAAGLPDAEKSASLIQTLAAKRREIRERQEKDLAQIAANHTLDSAQLAKVPTEKLAAAKKSFAVLSEELSASEWITLIGGYAKVISQGADQLTSPTDKAGK